MTMHPRPAAVVRVLEEVRRLVREIVADQEVTVYLYGSWARGGASAASDIDLALEAPHPLPPGTLARLRERLEESHVPYRVEVVELREVEPAFRRRVLEEGERWSA